MAAKTGQLEAFKTALHETENVKLTKYCHKPKFPWKRLTFWFGTFYFSIIIRVYRINEFISKNMKFFQFSKILFSKKWPLIV